MLSNDCFIGSNLQSRCNPDKNSNAFLHRNRKKIIKIICKYERSLKAKEILSKKHTAGGFTIPLFKLHYRAIVIKTAWFWYKIRFIQLRYRAEDPATRSYTTTTIWLSTRTQKKKSIREMTVFNKQCSETGWLHLGQEN